MNLSTSLDKIKGVGEKTALQLSQAGLKTVGDLIYFFPRRYEDFSNLSNIVDLKPGKVTIRARVEDINTKQVRRGMRITTATLADGTSKVRAVWFNQPYRVNQLKSGKEFYFSGEFEFSYNRFQITSPSAELASNDTVQTDRVLPIYKSIKGLKSNLVRKILIELKPVMGMLKETLPEEIVKNENLISMNEALLKVHFPESMDDVKLAKERLGFEELFQLLLASQLNKQANTKLKSWPMPFDNMAINTFVKSLPFQLTASQKIAAWDILKDLEKTTPMNRMLQGDVGSGKTVVAGLVACQAARSGFQTALMAPTEILASQHAETLANLLEPMGVRVGLLTGKVTGRARTELYEKIADGEVDVIVGTQALIQDKLIFYKLGLVIIDEQHRFGVKQRQWLLSKSDLMPHLLTMSATPIPRSLALTLYGELDISILNELPAGRKPIITKIWSPNSRPQLYDSVDKEISNGRQVYVICSLVEDNMANDTKSVEAEYKRLQNSVFKHRRIGLLHGKLKPIEKAAIMSDFASGKIDILVSTTVVEVGVDVPNATIIIIEDADNFGLAQLHQLRGRVGRGEQQSYCYLMSSDSNKPSQRLRAIEKSNDGFYLAEVDLKMRGPGEIYGQAQHGDLNLQIANLADTKLIMRAQRCAKKFVELNLNLLQYKQLSEKVEKYQRLTTLN